MTDVAHYTEITNPNVTTCACGELQVFELPKLMLCYIKARRETLIGIMFSQMDDAHDKLGGGKTNYRLEMCKQSVSRRQHRLASMPTSSSEGKVKQRGLK